VTRINGEVKQNTVIQNDMIFTPEHVLSWMSQSEFKFPALFVAPAL
jgi:2-keto-4-pentenoate hydratase/2-oxohepta-3-ene-1,7-dioic acid hydratase in catechol pathway